MASGTSAGRRSGHRGQKGIATLASSDCPIWTPLARLVVNLDDVVPAVSVHIVGGLRNPQLDVDTGEHSDAAVTGA